MYIQDTIKVGNFNLKSVEGLSCESSSFDIKNMHLFNAILIFYDITKCCVTKHFECIMHISQQNFQILISFLLSVSEIPTNFVFCFGLY